jgi:hypothetical protein
MVVTSVADLDPRETNPWPRRCYSGLAGAQTLSPPSVWVALGRSGYLLLSRSAAVFGARGCTDHFEFFAGHKVIALVGNDAHGCAPGGPLGLIYQQLQFQLALSGDLALLGELLAVVIIIFAGISEESTRPMAAGEQPNKKPQIAPLVATRGARRMGAVPMLEHKSFRTDSHLHRRSKSYRRSH